MECGTENDYEFKKEARRYKNKGYDFVMDVEVPFCKRCGAPIEDEELEEKIAQEANKRIREALKIISREEIVSILKKYDMSQKYMSKLLGWGEITLTRYITGGYTPNKENSDRLESLKNPYIFLKLLENSKNEKSQGEVAYQKAKRAVNGQLDELERQNGKIYKVINWFLAQSSDEVPVTPLSLQKLLYFAQGLSDAINQKWLFDNDCQAWAHGAVYPEIYKVFRKFEYLPLPKIEKEILLDEQELDILRIVKQNYFDIYSAKALESICHKEEPYIIARGDCSESDRCTNVIRKSEIRKYYRHICERYKISRGNTKGIREYLNSIV